MSLAAFRRRWWVVLLCVLAVAGLAYLVGELRSRTATADSTGLVTESDETNNTTWVDLKLTLNHKGKGSGGNKVSVIGYGPLP